MKIIRKLLMDDLGFYHKNPLSKEERNSLKEINRDFTFRNIS